MRLGSVVLPLEVISNATLGVSLIALSLFLYSYTHALRNSRPPNYWEPIFGGAGSRPAGRFSKGLFVLLFLCGLGILCEALRIFPSLSILRIPLQVLTGAGAIAVVFTLALSRADLKRVPPFQEAPNRRTEKEGLSLAVEAARLATWTHDFGTNIFTADEEFRRIFEIPESKKTLSLEDVLARMHPSDADRVHSAIYGKNPGAREVPFELEHRIVVGRGEESWVNSRGRLYRDAQGRPARIAGVIQEVTARKRMEFDREKFLLMAESSNDIIGFISNDLTECYLNPTGSDLLEIAHVDDARSSILKLLGAGSGESLERFENGHQRNVVVGAPGAQRILQVRVHVVHSQTHDEPLGLAVIARDVSKEQRYKEELEKAVRSRDEFLAMVSHDLRNPMNVILGWVQILRNNTVSREQFARIITSLEKNARLQDKLIADLLDVTRLMNGKMMFRPTRTRLSDFLHHVCDSARLSAAQKNIRMHAVLPAEDLWLMADAERMQQVLWNLLSNAVKFTPEGGLIDVQLLPSAAGEIIIEVRDSGVGIAPDQLAHVWDRFWQESVAGTRKGGLGLGLAIVKGIVELHGGTVEAHSDGKDRGTAFRMKLPRVLSLEASVQEGSIDGRTGVGADVTLTASAYEDAGAVHIPHVPHGTTLPPMVNPDAGTPTRVLLVEDSPEICDLFSSMLHLLGCEVDTASTAREGLSKVLAKDYNLLLCDLELPREDGFWLVQKLREVEAKHAGVRLKVVACSAKYAVNRGELRALGFDDFIPKPLSIGDLERAIKKLADGEDEAKSGEPGGRACDVERSEAERRAKLKRRGASRESGVGTEREG